MKTTHTLRSTILLILAALLLAACGSKKQTVATSTAEPAINPETGMLNVSQIVQAANANRQEVEALTARINLSLESGVRSVTFGGALRMKRNDVIQISVVTFGVVEVARLEITKNYFLLVDKLGRQYLQASYKDIPFLAAAGIDFSTFQSLLWDELFLFGASGQMPTDDQFKKTSQDKNVQLVNADNKRLVLSFLVNALSGLVRETQVSQKTTPEKPDLTWQYQEYGKLGRKEFPTKMAITIANGAKPIHATLSLAKLEENDEWEKRTDISKRTYTEVTVERLLSRILSLTN